MKGVRNIGKVGSILILSIAATNLAMGNIVFDHDQPI